MQVIRVQNPNLLGDPRFQEFIKEATSLSIWKQTPFEAILEEMKSVVVSKHASMHVVVDEGDYRALAVTYLPQGALEVVPQVVVFYVRKGSKKGVKSSLILALVDFLTEKHYTSFWAVNATGAPDSVYKRAFRRYGNVRRIGSVMECSLHDGQ